MFWLTEKVYFLPGHCWSHVVLVTDFPVSKSPILENYLSCIALVSVIIKTFFLFKPLLILDIVFTVWNGLKTLRPCQTEEINSGGGDPPVSCASNGRAGWQRTVLSPVLVLLTKAF